MKKVILLLFVLVFTISFTVQANATKVIVNGQQVKIPYARCQYIMERNLIKSGLGFKCSENAINGFTDLKCGGYTMEYGTRNNYLIKALFTHNFQQEFLLLLKNGGFKQSISYNMAPAFVNWLVMLLQTKTAANLNSYFIFLGNQNNWINRRIVVIQALDYIITTGHIKDFSILVRGFAKHIKNENAGYGN